MEWIYPKAETQMPTTFPYILGLAMQNYQKWGDLKLNLFGKYTGLWNPKTHRVLTANYLTFFLLPVLFESWFDKKRSSKIFSLKMLDSTNSFLNSYLAFKIQVVALRCYLPKTLVNDSKKGTDSISGVASIWGSVKIFIC